MLPHLPSHTQGSSDHCQGYPTDNYVWVAPLDVLPMLHLCCIHQCLIRGYDSATSSTSSYKAALTTVRGAQQTTMCGWILWMC